MWTEIQDWLSGGRDTILAAAGVGLLMAVIGIGVMKRSLLAAFGTLIFGSLLWWGMANSDWLRDRAGSDFDTGASAAQVVEIDGVGTP